ncbi:IPT/TIG domain-containing protein [Actinoplanes sp. NPDC026623]|uniref:IPT/TIG domain-containing protein n=1 Tax=Actinoplanes sp. NPDC026623 TaxID=3155610 RepID=UPI0033E52D7B
MKVRAHKAVIAAAAVAAGAGIFGITAAASAATSLLPTVTKLSVAKGSTAGGTVVSITGTNFDTVTAVKVGGTGGTAVTSFLISSPTEIVAKVAAGTGSKLQFTVTNPTGSSVDTVADDFTFLAPMDSVAAAALLNPFGKSTITVTTTGAGTSADLFKANKVTATVNGTSSPVTWVSDTSVKVAAPAGDPSATAASVVLYHDGVAGAADTTHAKYAAVITKLSKTSGSTAGGGTIAISGKGLSTATAFNFGATAATACAPVALKTDTDWTCTIPAVAAGGVSVKAVLPTISYGVLPTATYILSDVS